MDFKIPSSTLDKLNELADQIMDMVDGQYPFFIVYAVNNVNKKTEYKYFYSAPSELGYKLCENKMQDIFDLHNIPRDGTPCSPKDFSMPKDEKDTLKQTLNSFMFYCQNAGVPCFVQIVVDNNIKDNTTEYIMDIVSPYRLLKELYDDKITKVLRYTLEENIYPSRIMDINDESFNINKMLTDIAEHEDTETETYPDDTAETSGIYSAIVYDPESAEYDDAVSDIIRNTSEIIDDAEEKAAKAKKKAEKQNSAEKPNENEKPKKKRGRKKKSEIAAVTDTADITETSGSETSVITEDAIPVTETETEITKETETTQENEIMAETDTEQESKTPDVENASETDETISIISDYSSLGDIIKPKKKKKEKTRSELYEKYKDILEKFPDDFCDGEYD